MSDLGLEIQLEDLDTKKKHRIDRWTSYSVTSNLMGVDTFQAEVAATEEQRWVTAHCGQRAIVTCYGALQITAIIDERSEAVNTERTDLQIAGRGVGGILLDAAVDPKYYSLNNLTLQQVVERITTPYVPDYIWRIVTNNAANRFIVSGGKAKNTIRGSVPYPVDSIKNGVAYRRWVYPTAKVNNPNYKIWGKDSPFYRGIDKESLKQTRIKPGEKIWEVITRLCKMIAAHPYVGADGSLIIMRPQYKFQSSAYGSGIVLKWDRKLGKATGGNVRRAQFDTSIADRHSELVAWGTGKAKKTTVGRGVLKNSWSTKDPSPAFWVRTATPPYVGAAKLQKKEITAFKNVRDKKFLRRMIRSQMESKALGGFSLDYEIGGHHINGVMPTVDSMIQVDDDRFDLHDSFYIKKVIRKFSMSEGRSTIISLIPSGIWLAVDHDIMTDDNEYLGYMAKRIYW